MLNRGTKAGLLVCLAACCLLATAATPALAQEAMSVGEHHEIHIASRGSSDVVPTPTASGVRYTVHHAGATYIALHFADFDLAPGERLVVSDAGGGQSYTMTGRGKMSAETFWAQHVKGDTIVVELVRAGEAPDRGFTIDGYAAGFVDLGGAGTDAICGANDKRNAVCYQASHPTEYARSRAVARILIQGTSLCTGWLASAQNHLVTNEHCISSATAALNSDYEFMAEAPGCNDGNCQLCWTGTIFSGATFIQDSPALDYALLQIPSGNPAATYGFLTIDDRAATIGEQIYIPQHAGGRAKELGIASSASNDPGGVCHVTTFSPGCSSSAYQDVGYSCDTEGGSSGSPVLATSSHEVIALHHCASCPNRAVPIHLVCDQICGFFGPECTTGADCDDGDPCTADSCDGESCLHDSVPGCCGNGVCDGDEDCDTCAADCLSGAGASCGNGTCETGNGEDCLSCPSDCNGVTGGPRRDRFCCGSDTACSDSRCSGGTLDCIDVPTLASCCGDGVCEGGENGANCDTDCATCSVNADCADGDPCTTDQCSGGLCSNTPLDCADGDACTVDTCSGGVCSHGPLTCDDGDACTTDGCAQATGCLNVPLDCDDGDACTADLCSGGTCSNDALDCDDGDDCTADGCNVVSGCTNVEPGCQNGDGCCPTGCIPANDDDCAVACAPIGSSCVADTDCCSSKCRGPSGGKTCR